MTQEGSLRYANFRREAYKHLISKEYKTGAQTLGIISDLVVYPAAAFESVKEAYKANPQNLFVADVENAVYEVMLVIQIQHSELSESYYTFKNLDEYLKEQKKLS